MTDKWDDEFVKKIIDTNGIFVSVGCGMGMLEKRLRDAGKIVICVDPNDYDQRDQYLGVRRVLTPDYKFVSDLILDKPNIVGKVHLILSHPLPDYTIYDIMAVLKLEPKNIFLYYMKGGGAGSWLLQRFLRKNGVQNTGKLLTDKNFYEGRGVTPSVCPIKYRYTQVYEKDEFVVRGNYPFEHTYSILERKEPLDFVYTESEEFKTITPYSLEEKEEFVLRGIRNIEDHFKNCEKYLYSLALSGKSIIHNGKRFIKSQ